MPPQGKLEDRVEELERQLRHVLDLLAKQQPVRLANMAKPNMVRLAKTTDPESPTMYPTAPANTYPIIFLNGTFTESGGDQTPTLTDRQSGPATIYAHERPGDAPYREVGTEVWVIRQNGRWWILKAAVEGDGKVKVNTDDELDYLEDQFADLNPEDDALYDAAVDLSLPLDVIDSSGDKLIRIFVDASAIAGWDPEVLQLLGHAADGGIQWIDIGECDPP